MEGTGEPNRAIDCPREAEAEGELRSEARDDEGTARGFVDSVLSFAMAGVEVRPMAVLRGC